MTSLPEVSYKASKTWLFIYLIIDVILCWFLIGFYFLIKHLIQYSTNFLKLTSQSVLLKTGWLTIKNIEIPYTKVNSVTTNINLIGQIFGYGDIVILTGNDISGQVFHNVDKPELVKQEIMRRVGSK